MQRGRIRDMITPCSTRSSTDELEVLFDCVSEPQTTATSVITIYFTINNGEKPTSWHVLAVPSEITHL